MRGFGLLIIVSSCWLLAAGCTLRADIYDNRDRPGVAQPPDTLDPLAGTWCCAKCGPVTNGARTCTNCQKKGKNECAKTIDGDRPVVLDCPGNTTDTPGGVVTCW